jgi:hypothetical protein
MKKGRSWNLVDYERNIPLETIYPHIGQFIYNIIILSPDMRKDTDQVG